MNFNRLIPEIRPGFKKIDKIDESCFNLYHFITSEEDLLLVATYSSVSQIDKNLKVTKNHRLCSHGHYYSRKLNPARVIIGNENGVESIYRKDHKWLKEGKLEGIDDECRFISEDLQGNFWVGTYNIGCIV